MTVKSLWLRRIHKWIGLAIGLQFLLWAISGAAMALLSMDEVAGGRMAEPQSLPLPAGGKAWPRISRSLGEQPVESLSLRTVADRHLIEVGTAQGLRLFDASDGAPVAIDARAAAAIARAAHPDGDRPVRVAALAKADLAVRDHDLPIWKVEFEDEGQSAYYVSATSGALLERRNDTWRWWDFFWMLHNMDYAERTSFNHPLIIAVGFAMSWLAATGFWLLFRTMWRHDLASVRRWTQGHRR